MSRIPNQSHPVTGVFVSLPQGEVKAKSRGHYLENDKKKTEREREKRAWPTGMELDETREGHSLIKETDGSKKERSIRQRHQRRGGRNIRK